MTIKLGKIFVRSLVGIVTAGVVTVLVGATLPVETMVAMYGAIGIYVYLDKDVSGDMTEWAIPLDRLLFLIKFWKNG